METIQLLLGWLGGHLLPLVFVISAVDAVGVPFPGRTMLVAAGIATTGLRDVALLVAMSVMGSLVGDHVLYTIGRRRGPRLLSLYCRLSLGSARCVETTLAFFRRFGAMAVLVCRFSTGVRLFAAILAGTGEISYARFVTFDLAGTTVYSTLLIALGALFGATILEHMGGPARALLFLGPAVILTVLAYRLVRRWRYGPASEDRLEFTE